MAARSSTTIELIAFIAIALPISATWYFSSLGNAILLSLALIIGSVVPLVCALRGNAAQRQEEMFTEIEGLPMADTAYARIARHYFSYSTGERLLTAPGFRGPAIFLTVLVLMFALIAFFGHRLEPLLETPNLFLGGTEAAPGIADYQRATLLTISMAALGAYVIIVLRLVKRVNNFDIDPISFYFFSFHIIQAVVVAAVTRHLLVAIPGIEPTTPVLAGVGFAIGLQPDLFMTFVARWVREKLSMASSPTQAEPSEDLRPTNLSLSMLEGMTKEKRARFEEMDIDNCQALAECNPYVLWARTAFQMQQILDWIAQAQLYILVKEDGLKKLRPYGIRDIFGFVTAAETDASEKVANLLGVPVEVLAANVKNLHTESSYTRLLEVRNVLLDGAAAPEQE